MKLTALLAFLALGLSVCGPSSARVNDARDAYYQTSDSMATDAVRAAFADFGVDDAASDDELVVSKPRPYADGGASVLRDRDASRTRGHYDSLWWIEVSARVIHAYDRSHVRYEENVAPPDWVDELVIEKQIAIADRLQQQRLAPPIH